ncbi:hypothetical protein HMPREF9086_1601 [Enterobacter hormaechei ATCC 49162]|nr:hypothetical protein HMPREF9086_1601 [Enterobacter hormaechei ATCC 49162]
MPTALAPDPSLCCAGSGSVAADFDNFITEKLKHTFLDIFLLCHKTFTHER